MSVYYKTILEKVGVMKRDVFVVVDGRDLWKDFMVTMVINFWIL
jgi:hypothetical protein